MVWASRGLMSVLVALLLASACSEESEPPPNTMKPRDAGFIAFDSGTTNDAGPVDTGVGPTDTGVGPTDTGVGPTDSGIDAGPDLDTGVVDLGVDAGAPDTGLFVPIPSVPGDVVITEIMQNPSTLTDAQGEWIELYNATSEELSLEGCVLSDLGTDNHTIAESLLVPAFSHVALSRNADPGFVPDYVYSGFILTNDVDEVIITCDGIEIDQVVYDDGATFPDPDGASMNLDLQTTTSTANDVGGNWCAATTDYNGDFGTPGADNTDC